MNNAGKTPVSLGLLGAAAFMVIADVRVIDPLLHIIADEFKVGVGSAAIIVSAYTIPYGLFQLVYGPLGDRIGKLKVITAALTAFAVGTAACAFVPNIMLLTLLRFLTGVVAAGIIPVTLAYIGDNFPYEQRQTAIGKYLSALVLGQILGGSLGGIFGQYVSWRELFLVFGVVSLVISIELWRKIGKLRHETHSHVPFGWETFRPYLQLMTQPAAQTVIIGVFIEGFCLFGGFAYIGAFLRDRYNLPYVAIGFMISGFGIGGLIYSRSVKYLVRRLGERGLMGFGGVLMCISFLAIALWQNWVLFVPFNILMGLGFYMMHSTLQTQATELAPEARGTAVSLFAFNLFIGQGIGAAAFGRIVDSYGYIPCFIITGIAIALLALWLVKQKQQS
ncbi:MULTISPECIES: MFS transporter [unclassified Tolypothrix]|uniref:MFS transporter n=1 Tax=unclassified Tolypothrix TaxID=2649714 RepID=UPI0005EAA412|nr:MULTISPECIES: MFS transporter [unclassified Tolypothrix]BAY88243.1 putative MDR related permease [Microchaete diplosiphon NIES-3275]EKF02420.1 transporter, major facilitator family protein [Tolypothrix sp. PCC 7601]MBE9087395.1 MFS transporter [Tolypothrix sp. LEGE 11397]UYD28942.1 MFS transporter [Tolypothrix sp. PCC 7712]UYD35145.1 MFS transporter [Tolypothrix sp. PCC 7601]